MANSTALRKFWRKSSGGNSALHFLATNLANTIVPRTLNRISTPGPLAKRYERCGGLPRKPVVTAMELAERITLCPTRLMLPIRATPLASNATRQDALKNEFGSIRPPAKFSKTRGQTNKNETSWKRRSRPFSVWHLV